MPALPVCYLCSSSSGQCVNFSHVIYQPCLFHFLNLNLSLGKVPSQLHWYCFWLYWEQWTPKCTHTHTFRQKKKIFLQCFIQSKQCNLFSVITWLPLKNADRLSLRMSARVPASFPVWWTRRALSSAGHEEIPDIISRHVKHTTQWIQMFPLSSAVSGITVLDKVREKLPLYRYNVTLWCCAIVGFYNFVQLANCYSAMTIININSAVLCHSSLMLLAVFAVKCTGSYLSHEVQK